MCAVFRWFPFFLRVLTRGGEVSNFPRSRPRACVLPRGDVQVEAPFRPGYWGRRWGPDGVVSCGR